MENANTKQLLSSMYNKASKILSEAQKINLSDVSNTDISKLNDAADDVISSYKDVCDVYNEFINKERYIQENLIGLTCGEYYISFANKYLKKVLKFVNLLKAINSGENSIPKYLNEIQVLINAYLSERISIEELKIRVKEILGVIRIISGDITDNVPEYQVTEDKKTKERILQEAKSLNGSTYYYDKDVLSYMGVFQDNTSLYGTGTKVGAIISIIKDPSKSLTTDYVYLSWPSKKIHNLKMKFVTEQVVLWFYRSYYIGIYDSEDEEDESEAVRLKCRIFWKGVTINNDIDGITISTGYRVSPEYVKVPYGEVKESNYKNYYVKKTENEVTAYTKAESYDINGTYYTRKRKSLNDIEPSDLQTHNVLGEEYEILSYSSSEFYPLFDDNELTTKAPDAVKVRTVIVFDEDTYTPNNPNKLADSADVYIYANDELLYQMTMNSKSQENGVYKFTSNLTKVESEEDKSNNETTALSTSQSSKNLNGYAEIPVMLTVSDRKFNASTNKYSAKIELSVDSSQTLSLFNIEQYEPIQYIMTDVDQIKESVVDLRNVLNERPSAETFDIAQSTSSIDIDSIDSIDNKDDEAALLAKILASLNNILDLLNKNMQRLTVLQDSLLYDIRKSLVQVGKALNTFKLGETVRESIDEYYDSSEYTDLITEFSNQYSSISTYSDLSLEAILNKIKDKSIEELNTKITEISDNITDKIIDFKNALIMLEKIKNTYEPLFDHTAANKSTGSIEKSLSKAINTYTGQELYSASFNYSGEMFLFMDIYGDTFDTWLEKIKDNITVYVDLMPVHYMLNNIVVKSSFDGERMLKDIKDILSLNILNLIKIKDITTNHLSKELSDIINTENELYEEYNITVDDDLNSGVIPLLLSNNNSYYNDINYIDLKKILKCNANGDLIGSKYYPALTLLVYKALYNGDFNENVENFKMYIADSLNFRTMLLIREYNSLIDSVFAGDDNKDTRDNNKIFANKIQDLINKYYKIYSYYYDSTNRHTIYDNGIISTSIFYNLLCK